MVLDFVVFGLVSLVPCQDIGGEAHLWNDLFCVVWNIKPKRVTCRCLRATLGGMYSVWSTTSRATFVQSSRASV